MAAFVDPHLPVGCLLGVWLPGLGIDSETLSHEVLGKCREGFANWFHT